MEYTELYRCMEDPAQLSDETLPRLERLLDEFPYFHTAGMLYLKNLAVTGDFRFSSELKKRSICVPDRRKLFLLIEGEKYGLDRLPEEKSDAASDDTFALIDNYLMTVSDRESKPAEAALLFQPSVSSDYIYWSLTQGPAAEAASEKEEVKLKHQDLIDNFIRSEEERGTASVFSAPERTGADGYEVKLPEESVSMEDTGCFTETLARIYVKQKRYEKALQIIKKLSLNYPEKNVYFADQIRFLEKLIINTKK